MSNPTMWFEVSGKDQQALKGFYSELFGWQLTDSEEMPYSMVAPGESGGIPGGIGVARRTTRATSPSTSRSTTSTRSSRKSSGSAAGG